MSTLNTTQTYHHGNLRRALIEAGIRLLDAQGIAAVSIRGIAKSVGVAHSAPANHFKNKKELHAALYAEIASHFIDHVRSEMPQSETDQDSLKSLIHCALEYGLTYPHRYRLLWQSEHPISDAIDEIYDLLVNILRPCAEKNKVDVESQAIAVWCLIHGYVVLRLDGHLKPGVDALTGLSRQLAIIGVISQGLR